MAAQCKAEVLGKLFVIPGTLCVLPDHQTIVDFVNTALNQIVPGLASVSFCLEGTVGIYLFRLYPRLLELRHRLGRVRLMVTDRVRWIKSARTVCRYVPRRSYTAF